MTLAGTGDRSRCVLGDIWIFTDIEVLCTCVRYSYYDCDLTNHFACKFCDHCSLVLFAIDLDIRSPWTKVSKKQVLVSKYQGLITGLDTWALALAVTGSLVCDNEI